jgi:hypothetical protein
MRGERLNDGLSAVAAGQGPPLAVLPGFEPAPGPDHRHAGALARDGVP